MATTQEPVLVIMGAAGCGKSTVAGILAGALGWDLLEGDDLHPPANVTKMASGTPLTDDDRWPWLESIATWIAEHTGAGRPGIVTCSALKRSYRDVLRGEHVIFVHLVGTRAQLSERLSARLDHYMPVTLLDSQLATLEAPGDDEEVITADIGEAPGEIAATVLREVEKRLGA